MNAKQKQALLFYLGYYVGGIDGVLGSGSREAIKAFQRDFFQMESKVDGICGPETEQALKHAVAYGMPAKDVPDKTGTFWDEIEFFEREEFRCQCGGRYCDGFPVEPDERMVRTVDALRRRLGVPITIVSGLRCARWNEIQGGVANSQHMYGEASDIRAQGKTQAVVEAELDRIGGVRYHYPIENSDNVHFDVPKGKR